MKKNINTKDRRKFLNKAGLASVGATMLSLPVVKEVSKQFQKTVSLKAQIHPSAVKRNNKGKS